MNLDLADIPKGIPEGIYAGKVLIENRAFPAAIHYGPRPVHQLGKSFEAHLLEVSGITYPVLGMVKVELKKKLREVQDFKSEEELSKQIQRDIEECRVILTDESVPR